MIHPGMIAFLFKKKEAQITGTKKCTRRGSVWYKKLVSGTKVLFDDFLGRAVRAIFKSERCSVGLLFLRTGLRN